MTNIDDKALNRARSVLLDHGFIVPFTIAEKAVAAYLEALSSPSPSPHVVGIDKKLRSITDSRDLARKLYEEAENENVVLRREIERLKSELSQARGE